MRGNVIAALTASAAIAAFVLWRIEERSAQPKIDATMLVGAWSLASSEDCTPTPPAQLLIGEDGAFQTANTSGRVQVTEDGRVLLTREGLAPAKQIYRVNPGSLEVLDVAGCKASYARAE